MRYKDYVLSYVCVYLCVFLCVYVSGNISGMLDIQSSILNKSDFTYLQVTIFSVEEVTRNLNELVFSTARLSA